MQPASIPSPVPKSRANFAALLLITLTAQACVRFDPPQIQPAGSLQNPEDPDISELGGGPALASSRADEPWAKPEAWPSRIPVWSGLRRSTIVATGIRPMGVIRSVPGPLVTPNRSAADRNALNAGIADDIARLTARLRREGNGPALNVVAEGPGSLVFITAPASHEVEESVAGRPVTYLVFTSGHEDTSAIAPASPTAEAAAMTIKLQRTWMALYGPWNADEPSRGLVVFLPGLFGTPQSAIEPLIASLRKRNWSVLRLLSHSSRFTESKGFVLDPESPAAKAKDIADELTGRAAECAYAVQAAALWIRQQYPDLLQGPRIAIGMSAGAMILPTVVAREPDAYSGAVLIAGGADFLNIALQSNYSAFVNSVNFKWGKVKLSQSDQGQVGVSIDERKPTAAMKSALLTAYADSAPLDSLFTIRSLLGKHLLFIHASSDRAVPAAAGERLWTLAGKPERWVFDTGHEFLFIFFPAHIDRLIDWLDKHLPAEPRP